MVADRIRRTPNSGRSDRSPIYLERAQTWALPQYASVKAALSDPDTFSSVNGLHLNPEGNQWVTANSVLATDGLEHARLKRVLSKELAPRAIKDLGDSLRARADALVAGLAERESFDAVRDLAAPYVTDVIFELMGLPDVDPGDLMKQIESVFDTFGAPNPRVYAGLPAAQAMFEFLQTVATRENVRPGSWLAAAHAAADRGEIAEHECVMTMAAYLTAGHGHHDPLHRDGRAPPDRRPRAVEAWCATAARRTRRSSARRSATDAPIQGFGRRVTADTKIGDVTVQQATRSG
ncbi:hypothetical protein ACU686_43720 [Yinghuangia aomiensis]